MEPDNASGEPRHDKGDILRRLAKKLEGRGLRSNVVTYSSDKPGDEPIEEIVVTNPADSERGTMRIGDDGAITWEFFGDMSEAGAGRLLDEATNALRARGVRLQPEMGLNGPRSDHC
jgi:hypothetical protein